MHDISVPYYDRFLGALAKILAKADAHCTARKIDPAALLNFRLFPDMFPLIRQVQLVCDFAARGAARLSEQTPQSFPDTETSFAELLARIAAVRSYIASFPPEGFTASEVTLKVRGQDMTLSARDFLLSYSLPQFHFHLTTTYNILRHNGVELGKLDYMGAS